MIFSYSHGGNKIKSPDSTCTGDTLWNGGLGRQFVFRPISETAISETYWYGAWPRGSANNIGVESGTCA